MSTEAKEKTTKKPGKAKTKKKPAKKINLQHQQFIDSFIDSDNPKTFNNATQSYLEAYPASQYNTAGVNGSRLLGKAVIQDSIEAILLELNMGPKVRLKAITEVLTGKHRQETVTVSKKLDAAGKETGESYTSTTLKAPTASDLIKASDHIAKLDGTYTKNKAKADVVSAEMKELIRRQRKELTGNRGGGK